MAKHLQLAFLQLFDLVNYAIIECLQPLPAAPHSLEETSQADILNIKSMGLVFKEPLPFQRLIKGLNPLLYLLIVRQQSGQGLPVPAGIDLMGPDAQLRFQAQNLTQGLLGGKQITPHLVADTGREPGCTRGILCPRP